MIFSTFDQVLRSTKFNHVWTFSSLNFIDLFIWLGLPKVKQLIHWSQKGSITPCYTQPFKNKNKDSILYFSFFDFFLSEYWQHDSTKVGPIIELFPSLLLISVPLKGTLRLSTFLICLLLHDCLTWILHPHAFLSSLHYWPLICSLHSPVDVTLHLIILTLLGCVSRKTWLHTNGDEPSVSSLFLCNQVFLHAIPNSVQCHTCEYFFHQKMLLPHL